MALEIVAMVVDFLAFDVGNGFVPEMHPSLVGELELDEAETEAVRFATVLLCGVPQEVDVQEELCVRHHQWIDTHSVRNLFQSLSRAGIATDT